MAFWGRYTIALRRWRKLAIASSVFVLPLGCKTPKGCDQACVSQRVETRFGTTIGTHSPLVPETIAQGQPLPEEQAVMVALWNNAAFLEALMEIDLTRGDLVQAGLLPNPEFVYYWPAWEKPFKYLVDFPLESIWLRPIRIKATAVENERACARLTQTALDLIRDTRQAYADLQLAHDRVKVAKRAVDLREHIASLAEARLKAGDASPLEVSTARTDANLAQQTAIQAKYDVTVAEERLRNFLGLSDSTNSLVPANTPISFTVETALEDLVTEAIRTRPDAAAADHAAAAAAERVRFSKLFWFRILGLLDATSGRSTGHEFGPALRTTIPIFNRNQGGIARAEAEFEQLERRKRTVHNQIVLDVRQSHARFQQARAELDFLRTKTRPEVESAIRRAETAYKEGNVTYFIVLELNRQLIDTFLREAQLFADLRRSWAELERSVGRRLQSPTPAEEPPR